MCFSGGSKGNAAPADNVNRAQMEKDNLVSRTNPALAGSGPRVTSGNAVQEPTFGSSLGSSVPT